SQEEAQLPKEEKTSLKKEESFNDTSTIPDNSFQGHQNVSGDEEIREVIEQLIMREIEEFGYEEAIAKQFITFLENLGEPSDNFLSKLVSWRKRLLETDSVSESVILEITKELADSLVREIEAKSGVFGLPHIIEFKCANCEGFTQLFYFLGRSIGLSIKPIDVKETAITFTKESIREYLSHHLPQHIVDKISIEEIQDFLKQMGYIATIVVELPDNKVVMVDLTFNPPLISRPFRIEEEYRKEGIWWILKKEGNPLGLHRKIRILDRNGLIAAVEYNVGNAFVKEGNFEEAISHYSEAIKLDPFDYLSLYNRGLAYQMLNKIPEALEDYTRAEKIAPDDAKIYFNKGICLSILERMEEAKENFEKAIALRPSFAKKIEQLRNKFHLPIPDKKKIKQFQEYFNKDRDIAVEKTFTKEKKTDNSSQGPQSISTEKSSVKDFQEKSTSTVKSQNKRMKKDNKKIRKEIKENKNKWSVKIVGRLSFFGNQNWLKKIFDPQKFNVKNGKRRRRFRKFDDGNSSITSEVEELYSDWPQDLNDFRKIIEEILGIKDIVEFQGFNRVLKIIEEYGKDDYKGFRKKFKKILKGKTDEEVKKLYNELLKMYQNLQKEAELRAQEALKAMAIKLAEYWEENKEVIINQVKEAGLKDINENITWEELWQKVKSSNNKEIYKAFRRHFDELFGIRFVLLTAGKGSRYTPGTLIPKSLAGEILGETHVRLASKLSLLFPTIKPLVITENTSLVRILNEEGLRRFKKGEKISTFILPQEWIDKEKQKLLFGENTIIVAPTISSFNEYPDDKYRVEGFGKALRRAFIALDQLEERFKTRYLALVLGENAQASIDEMISAYFVSWLETIRGDYLFTAGGKLNKEVEAKGNLIFDDEGRFCNLLEWEAINKKLRKELIEEAEKEPWGRPINANVAIFRTDLYPHYVDGIFDKSRVMIDVKTGGIKASPWVVSDVLYQDWIAKGKKTPYPIGYVNLGLQEWVPTNIKNPERENKLFSSLRKTHYRLLKKLDENIKKNIKIEKNPQSSLDTLNKGLLIPETFKEVFKDAENLTLEGFFHIDSASKIIGQNIKLGNFTLMNSQLKAADNLDLTSKDIFLVNSQVEFKSQNEIEVENKTINIGNSKEIVIINNIVLTPRDSQLTEEEKQKVSSYIKEKIPQPASFREDELFPFLENLAQKGFGEDQEKERKVKDPLKELADAKKPLGGKGGCFFDKDHLQFKVIGEIDKPLKIFAHKFIKKGKEAIEVDMVFLFGNVKVSALSKVGRGVVIDNSQIRGYTYLGDGWELKNATVENSTFEDNDLFADFGKRGRISIYEQPSKGRMNALSVAEDSQISNSWIGIGSGNEFSYKERIWLIKYLNITNSIIPEGWRFKRLNEFYEDKDEKERIVITGILKEIEDLKEKYKQNNAYIVNPLEVLN
ncbi:MAG: hypothetical protein DRP68_06435, partial [Candidatus Omnitrophota bacterium]